MVKRSGTLGQVAIILLIACYSVVDIPTVMASSETQTLRKNVQKKRGVTAYKGNSTDSSKYKAERGTITGGFSIEKFDQSGNGIYSTRKIYGKESLNSKHLNQLNLELKELRMFNLEARETSKSVHTSSGDRVRIQNGRFILEFTFAPTKE